MISIMQPDGRMNIITNKGVMNPLHFTSREQKKSHKHSLSVVSDRTIQARCFTQPCKQLPSYKTGVQAHFSGYQNSLLQAKSLSLISRIDRLIKPPKKRVRTQTILKAEVFNLDQKEIGQPEINKGKLPDQRGSGQLQQKWSEVGKKSNDRSQYADPLSKSKVVRSFESNYRFEEKKPTHQSLRIDFNKHDMHLFSRSKRKVMAVEALSCLKKIVSLKQTRLNTQEKLHKQKFSSFSKVYYQQYMRHYLERRRMLGGKEWIKKRVVS